MRTLYNVILIFLIGFLSSTFLFELSPIDYKDAIIIDEPEKKAVLTLALEGENNFVNPKNIVIQHLSNLEMEISNLPENIFTADIYLNDKLIKSDVTGLENSAISIKDSSYVISENNPLNTSLNISQEKLNLKDGKYKIVLKSNIVKETDINTIDVFVEFDTGFMYYEATDTVPNREAMGLTLYFTDNEANILVPVTRFIIRELSMNKQVIYELQNGPKSTDLAKTIDAVNYCIYKDNTVLIDLPADNKFYNSESTAGVMAYNSFVKSMFAINKYLRVDTIRLTVDKYPSDNYFHGMSIRELITQSRNPILYVGYKIDGRMYLYEHELTDIKPNTNAKTIAEGMIEYYKNNIPEQSKSPIPNNLAINSAVLENNILTIDFNDAFVNGFDDQIKRKFMVDALVYSFTSIEDVNSIMITVNGNPVENFIEGKDITGILTPPNFINPEAID